jgi:Putative zinc-finger
MDETGSCKEVSQLLSIAMDRELTAGEQKQMMQHFKVCTWCYDHQDQLELIQKAGPRLDSLCEDDDSDIRLPQSIRDRIKCAMKDKTPPAE